MGYPLSSTAKFLYPAVTNLAAGFNSAAKIAIAIASGSNLSGFEAIVTGNAYPNELAKNPTGIDTNDNVFIKRLRLNSIFRVFQNVRFNANDESVKSFITLARGAAGTKGLAINAVDLKFYEWHDINLMLPYAATANINLWLPACTMWYNLPSEYTAQVDSPFVEIEFAHTLPIVLAP